MCRDHVARVRARQRDLDAAQAALVLLLPEPIEVLAPLARREGWTGPVLADPGRAAYRAYGLGRLPRLRVFTPRTLLMYLRFALRGRLPEPPGQDTLQQGGDFIVAGDGVVRFAHAGRSSDDRPSAEELVRCLRSIASSRPAPLG